MKIATFASLKTAPHLHRNLLPFKWLSKDNPQHQWSVSTSDQIGKADVIWLYGTLKEIGDWGRIAAIKRKGVRIVYTHDDTVWHHPEWRTDGPTEDHINSVNQPAEG